VQDFFAIKKEGLDDPFFSHIIRWGNSRRNLMFLSDAALAALGDYKPVEELAERLPPSFYRRDLLSRAQVLEMELFLSNYLLSSQGDRVAMAHSVELRHPFLDYRVIDYAFRLPAKWKISGLNEKFMLKRTFSGLLPDSIGKRPKQPYRAPIRELFSSSMSGAGDYVDEVLAPDYLKKSGYFNPDKVSRLLAKYRRADYEFSNESQDMALMGILSTQILYQQFVEERLPRPANLLPDKIIHRGALDTGRQIEALALRRQAVFG
jgi:asparagine synthase (glutamine-hydrolysing)